MHLATAAEGMARSDARVVYLDRARYLDPMDPELWYRGGILESRTGQAARAWQSWRRSLELSDRFFPDILQRSRAVLDAQQVLAQVLPDRPALLVRAAFYLYPQPDDARPRRPFLERAVLLFGDRDTVLEAADYRLKGTAERDLGRLDEAAEAYRAALTRAPDQAGWRFELAEILVKQARFDDARRELLTVLDQRPAHAEARELLGVVRRELVRKRGD